MLGAPLARRFRVRSAERPLAAIAAVPLSGHAELLLPVWRRLSVSGQPRQQLIDALLPLMAGGYLPGQYLPNDI